MSPAANVIFLDHAVSEQHSQMATGATNHIFHKGPVCGKIYAYFLVLMG
jgi:hypothetical protein